MRSAAIIVTGLVLAACGSTDDAKDALGINAGQEGAVVLQQGDEARLMHLALHVAQMAGDLRQRPLPRGRAAQPVGRGVGQQPGHALAKGSQFGQQFANGRRVEQGAGGQHGDQAGRPRRSSQPPLTSSASTSSDPWPLSSDGSGGAASMGAIQ